MHRPIGDILSEISSVRIPEKTKVVIAATKALNLASEAYSFACKAAILQKVVKVKQEAGYIEKILTDAVAPLRQMSTIFVIRYSFATG